LVRSDRGEGQEHERDADGDPAENQEEGSAEPVCVFEDRSPEFSSVASIEKG
jgi:hypothetical protein